MGLASVGRESGAAVAPLADEARQHHNATARHLLLGSLDMHRVRSVCCFILILSSSSAARGHL